MIQCVWGFQIKPGLLGVFDQEAIAVEPALDPLDETVEQTLEGLCFGHAGAGRESCPMGQHLGVLMNAIG